MNLRYRLFVWVVAVFASALLLSYVFEAHATRRNLEAVYQNLLTQLEEINQQKTEAIEDYLSDMLYKIQAEVDAVLLEAKAHPMIQRGFEPTKRNFERHNWLDAASLMITNKWIDFIQSTNESEVMSAILMHEKALTPTLHFPVNEANEPFHFVAIEKKDAKGEW